MAKIHLYGHGERASAVLDWLSRECQIGTEELASIIYDPQHFEHDDAKAFREIPGISIYEVRNCVSAEDIVIVASEFFEQAVGNLFAHGIYNVYNGNEIARRESADQRFMRTGAGLYIGPTTPESQGAAGDQAPHLSTELIEARRVPRHKLFIVNSMPKSGTVWMTAMLEDILGVKAREQITISHVGDIESDWHKENNHGALTLVRDMRDVVVSWYHNLCRSDLQFGYASPRYDTIEDFYRNYLLGLIFGTSRYYHGDLVRWLNLLGANGIPIIKYEDLVSDTRHCLRKVMNFWKVKASEERLHEVARDYSFATMRDTVTKQGGFVTDMVNSGHMRSGQVGRWRDEMPTHVAEDIEQRFAGYQTRLGYS